MNDELTIEDDSEIQAQLILLAASKHDIEALRTLLRQGSASVQDPKSGFTPLHAAIAACEDAQIVSVGTVNGEAATSSHVNGYLSGEADIEEGNEESEIAAGARTVRLLLQNGAIWNDVDKNDETPGCLALRLGLKDLYEIMVDAGVRAEMLLSRLDEYEPLDDDERADSEEELFQDGEAVDGHSPDDAVRESDRNVSASAIIDSNPANVSTMDEPRNEEYLRSILRFQDGRILDDASNGIMMAWETDIMKRTADLLCPKTGLRVLNVGHGMGIIDQFFQEKSPIVHHIIEAHPAVLARMKENGWNDNPNVKIHEGRWQDIVPKIMEQGIFYDAIYFDTFAEDYKALREFFSEFLIGLLEDAGKWGFFNGLGADRQICYDVYTKAVEMDLFEAGFDTEWDTLQVPEIDNGEWKGIKRKYWALREYKLPTCSFFA